MKKLLSAALVLVIVATGVTVYALGYTGKSPVSSDDSERLDKIVMTLLIPKIQKSVDDFYEPYISIEPTVAAYLGDSKITSIVGDVGSSIYTVTVELEPYVGPHISIGRDKMTFEISADGTVNMKKYEHLKSYDLPQNLQSLIKKPLP